MRARARLAGQASGVGRRRLGPVGHRPAPGGGGHALHVDEVLDGEADTGAQGVEAGDERAHARDPQRRGRRRPGPAARARARPWPPAGGPLAEPVEQARG